MKNGMLLIEGFGLDDNGRPLAAAPEQRQWQGMRWLTIARIDVAVDLDYEGRARLVTATLDGEEITEREIMNILEFRAPGANYAWVDSALEKIYWDGANVVPC